MAGYQSQHLLDHLKSPLGSFVFHVLVVLLAFWMIKPADALEQEAPLADQPVLDVSADISAYDVPPIPIQDLIDEPDVVEADVNDKEDVRVDIS